jgi:hypothetical protein
LSGVGPLDCGGVLGSLDHPFRLLFSHLAPALAPHRAGGHKSRAVVKPAGDRSSLRQHRRLEGQLGEDHLRDVLGSMRVAADLPQGGEIN